MAVNNVYKLGEIDDGNDSIVSVNSSEYLVIESDSDILYCDGDDTIDPRLACLLWRIFLIALIMGDDDQ